MKVKKSDIWPIVSEVFPNYTGRKFRVEARESITFYDTNWGGGTRNQYAAVSLSTGKSGVYTAPAPWVNIVEGSRAEILPDVVIVCHSIFCGTDTGITVYAHPSRFPALIGAGTE